MPAQSRARSPLKKDLRIGHRAGKVSFPPCLPSPLCPLPRKLPRRGCSNRCPYLWFRGFRSLGALTGDQRAEGEWGSTPSGLWGEGAGWVFCSHVHADAVPSARPPLLGARVGHSSAATLPGCTALPCVPTSHSQFGKQSLFRPSLNFVIGDCHLFSLCRVPAWVGLLSAWAERGQSKWGNRNKLSQESRNVAQEILH